MGVDCKMATGNVLHKMMIPVMNPLSHPVFTVISFAEMMLKWDVADNHVTRAHGADDILRQVSKEANEQGV